MRKQLVSALWRSSRIQLTFRNREGLTGFFMLGWTTLTLSIAIAIMSNSGYSAAEIAATLSAMTALNTLISLFVNGGALVQQIPFVGELFETLHHGFVAGHRDSRESIVHRQPSDVERAQLLPPPGPLEARGLSFAYGDALPVLTDITVRFEPGTITALVGRNGEGKSTLMRIL